jgi:Notch-like protein
MDDKISSKVLKYSLNMISTPLTYIFNCVLSTGTFPTLMKYSIVKPLFKKGDKSNLSNHRPMSLLTSFSKIFEKITRWFKYDRDNLCVNKSQFVPVIFEPPCIIYTRIYKHLVTHNILENSMDCYLKEIINALNNKNIVGGIFCDLHKAFDC